MPTIERIAEDAIASQIRFQQAVVSRLLEKLTQASGDEADIRREIKIMEENIKRLCQAA